jgi:uncharacterized membrane protein
MSGKDGGKTRTDIVPRQQPSSAGQTERFEATLWAGLVPRPEDCAKYEEIVPGATKFFMEQARRQTDHRMHLEATVVDANVAQARLGLYCGTIVLLAMIALAAFAISRDQDGAGVLIAGAALLGGAGSFVWGQYRQQRERQVKARDAQAKLPSRR